MPETAADLLKAIAADVRTCQACPLHLTRTNAVPGEGPVNARIAFIGEAPGRDEDEQGRPFVGRSGQLLRRTIAEIGVAEEEVFIGNVLKCRPPDNRDPLPAEIDCCRHYLMAQLVVVKPRIVVTLGRYSMNLLIDQSLKISKDHGKHILKDGLLYLPTYHPSAILRNFSSPEEFKRDLMKAKVLSDRQA